MRLAFGKNIIPDLTEDELFQIQDTSEKWFEDLILVNKHLSINNSLDIAGKWENIKMRFDDTLRSSQDTSEQWQIRNVQLYWLHGMFKQLLLLSSTIQANDLFRRPITQMVTAQGSAPTAIFPYSRFFLSSGEDSVIQAIPKLLLCFNSKIEALGNLLKDINYKPHRTELTAGQRQEIPRIFKRLIADLIETSPTDEMQKNHQRYILTIFSNYTKKKYGDNDTAFIIPPERVEWPSPDLEDQLIEYSILWRNIDHYEVLKIYLYNLYRAGRIQEQRIPRGTIPRFILQSFIEFISNMTRNQALPEESYDNLIWRACLLTERSRPMLPQNLRTRIRPDGYSIDAEELVTQMIQTIKTYAENLVNTRAPARSENNFGKRYSGFGKRYSGFGKSYLK